MDLDRPRPYQKTGVRQIHAFGGNALLADEQGLGKTPQAAWYAKQYVAGRILVVCPASIKENWRRELRRFGDMDAHIIYGRKPYMLPPARAYIINYDILGDPEHDGRDVWVRKFLMKRAGLELLIADEAQAIRNWDSKRARACRWLARTVPKRLCLSGTPLVNRAAELYTAISMIKPELFESRKLYLERYCDPQDKPWGIEYKGTTNPEELNRILRQHMMIRRRKVDVLKDLPTRTISVVPIELDAKSRREYDRAFHDFLDWMLDTYGPGHRFNAALQAEKMARMGYLKRLAAEQTRPMKAEWITNFREASDRKLIIFGIHKELMLFPLMKQFAQEALIITGSTPVKLRDPIFERFNLPDTEPLLLGNIEAAGVGWNCRSASDVAFVEQSFVPAIHDQAMARVHGLGRGTGRGVMAYFLVASNTIEEDVCKIIQTKQDNIDRVLDGKSHKELNVYDILTATYMEIAANRSRREMTK